MKRITLIATIFLMSMAQLSIAASAYHIRLKMPDANDTMVFLLHYYGKGRPTIFKVDSAWFDKSGWADFKSDDFCKVC